MTRRSAKSKLISWLLAAAFLAIQAIALAHEIKHDLRQHNDATCVLHLYTKHHGPATTDAALYATPIPCDAPPPPPGARVRTAPTLGYHTRAPPLPSEDTIV